jgi:ubiquinone/menaquinone biosynthesis C-methylase UbiE
VTYVKRNATLKRLLSRLFLHLLGTFFRWIYTSLAWAYDLVAGIVSLGRWKSWVLAAQFQAPPSPALELGFGPGHLQTALRHQGNAVYGVDSSRQMCRLAGGRIRTTGHDPRIARASAEQLPFANESFSCILATFPAPFILSTQTARESFRVLRPGGNLVVLLSVQMGGDALPERVLRSLLRWTGQQPAEDNAYLSALFSIYQEAGFSTRMEWQPCVKDHLLFLTMRKPSFIIKEI